MSGKTMIEKIINNHSKEEIKPGNIVWMDIDIRTARDFAGANVVDHLEKHYPEGQRIADIGRTFFTFDCVVPANNVGYAENQHTIRKFARKEGIKVYDVNSGIGSHVAIEQGFAYPGCTLVGTDSHLNILGSIGAFGQGMGDQDIAFTFKSGKTWFEVPHSVKVNVKGKIASNATPKDLTLALVKHFGSAGLLGLSAELYGQPINNLTLDGRITLASMVTEMGGIIGLIPSSKEVIDFCKKRSKFDFEPIYADEDASYQKTIEIDFDGLKPQIACPYSPENVKDVAEVAGKKVDSVIIGSCTNGRYSDIELAAKMIRGKQVKEGVMFKIVPATREIYGKMLKNDLLEIFYDAGVIVSHAACSTCSTGQIGMTGEGEVQVTTGNRNFKGKQGKGQTYLASPATAVATAITGEISVPEL
ncbi:aconitase/3-isopropylmalate dehydratase large subunit family protein [Candidatus Borrarchaeum sp.]|uniref:3-isopropylmalate dehydratase large subunit n=1 Tax=Candidatus Borrarchaeum sp. TaxID=2846742 RepID=UPI00257FAEB0|nr:aconitase/3-isopropylmalate dehydratase large subunit family protein [Candidatus Borrarchaeum sp.]